MSFIPPCEMCLAGHPLQHTLSCAQCTLGRNLCPCYPLASHSLLSYARPSGAESSPTLDSELIQMRGPWEPLSP